MEGLCGMESCGNRIFDGILYNALNGGVPSSVIRIIRVERIFGATIESWIDRLDDDKMNISKRRKLGGQVSQITRPMSLQIKRQAGVTWPPPLSFFYHIV